MTLFTIVRFTLGLACFGAALAGACGQDSGWTAQASGFVPGTIQIDRQGNVYVASGINNRYNHSTNAVIKYGPDGREVWRRGFPNLAELGAATLGMGLDEAGNVYVAGRSQTDPFMGAWSLMKLRPDGTQAWLVDGVGGVRRMAVDRLGQVYTAGWGDAVKYGPDGKLMWHLKLPLPPTMGALNVTVDERGHAYLVGHNGYGYAVTKVDPAGHRLWTSFYPEGQQVEGGNAFAAAVAGDGTVYVTGGLRDGMVTIKFSADGQRLWVAGPKKAPDGSYLKGSAIAVDSQGCVYVSASVFSFEPTNRALATISYDSNGQELWLALHRSSLINDTGGENQLAVDGNGHLCVSPKCFSGPWLGVPVVKYDRDGNELWCSLGSGVGTPADLALDRFGALYVTSLDGSTRKIPHLDALSATASSLVVSRGSGKRRPTASSFDIEDDTSMDAKAPAAPVGSAIQPGPIPTVKWMNQRIENSVFLAELAGETGAVYEIQRSTDLSNWLHLATMTCKDGIIHLADKESHRFPQCFYRAVKRP